MDEFFRSKRHWSTYKDLILEYYLHPYIPKVARLGKSVLLVDCCAGPGKFEDGEPGSPLIIANSIQHWRSQGKNVNGLFIEEIQDHYSALTKNLAPFGEVMTTEHGLFGDYLPTIRDRASTETVFLYVDPYSVKGLEFTPMKDVYDQIHQSGSSIEVLMNFNVATFMRWALAAMTRAIPDIMGDDPDYLADDPNERVEIATLNSIAGGDYWQEIASSDEDFATKLDQLIEEYARRLARSFQYVCWYAVKSKYHHRVPKYMLVYGTRHPDGLELMNDAMCKAREEFLGAEFNSPEFLFDARPERELPNLPALESEMLEFALSPKTRRELRIEILRKHFCQYSKKELNRTVESLIRRNLLSSSTGKPRINDNVLITAVS